MKIIVCVKQVPGTTNVVVDSETGILQRQGIETKLNPYDLFAIELALQLREKHGGTVTAISLGPPQSKAVLLETLCMGADNGILISDPRFAGSDVLSTSRALAQGVMKSGPFDLIICGKQTTDGDTAQVGPEISEFLDIGCAGFVTDICAFDEQQIIVKSALDNQIHQLRIPFPCLISVDKDINSPRLPSLKRKMAIDEHRICTYTLDDLMDNDECHYGLAGSPTQVCQVFPPDINVIREIHEDEDPAEGICQLLLTRKFI